MKARPIYRPFCWILGHTWHFPGGDYCICKLCDEVEKVTLLGLPLHEKIIQAGIEARNKDADA